MKFTLLPTSSKDYEASNGSRVEMITGFNRLRDKLSAKTFYELFGDNRKRLPEILGKRGCQWTGYVRWDVWKIQATPQTHIYMLSSKQGASIEVGGESEKDIFKINHVLEQIALALIRQKEPKI